MRVISLNVKRRFLYFQWLSLKLSKIIKMRFDKKGYIFIIMFILSFIYNTISRSIEQKMTNPSSNYYRYIQTTESTDKAHKSFTTESVSNHGNVKTSRITDQLTTISRKTTFWENVMDVSSQEKTTHLTQLLYDSTTSTVISPNLDDLTTSMVISTNSDDLTTSRKNPSDDTCYVYGSCEKPANTAIWYCNCDEDCVNYGDCCLKSNKTHIASSSINYECVGMNDHKNLILGFLAISACLTGFDNHSVIEKCSQSNFLQHGLPVIQNNKIAYKNKYCALCNNVIDYTFFDIQLYGVDLTIGLLDQLNNMTKNAALSFLYDRTNYELIPPINAELRSCVAHLIKNDQPLCKNYVNPRVMITAAGYQYYQNNFCIPSDNQYHSVCLGQIIRLQQTDSIQSLSVLFSFKDTSSAETESNQCDEWTEKIAENSLCSQLVTYKNYRVNLEYYLLSDKNLTQEDVYTIAFISALSFVVTNFTEIISTRLQIEVNDQNSIVKVKFTLTVVKRCFKHELSKIEKILNQRTLSIIIKENNNTATKFYIQSGGNIAQESRNPENFKTILSIVVFTEFLPILQRYNVESSILVLDTICYTLSLEVLISTENISKIFSAKCHTKNQRIDSEIRILPILTYVCFSVSVVSLTVLIVYNRIHGFVANIAESNLENLSVSLLASNMLFMIGVGAYKATDACYIIGVTLHYLWLAVFSYMSMAVVYIRINIVRMTTRKYINNEQIVRRRRVITVVGIIIPLLFVGPAVAVDKYGPSYLSSGYGGLVCFPDRYPANVIFFSGPVVVSLIIDLVSLFQIIFHVCKVRIETKHMRISDSYKDAKVYIRIVILSGVFWIIGILAAALESELLEYVFTILCGLQGLFVAFANLTTRIQKRKPPVMSSSTFTSTMKKNSSCNS